MFYLNQILCPISATHFFNLDLDLSVQVLDNVMESATQEI